MNALIFNLVLSLRGGGLRRKAAAENVRQAEIPAYLKSHAAAQDAGKFGPWFEKGGCK